MEQPTTPALASHPENTTPHESAQRVSILVDTHLKRSGTWGMGEHYLAPEAAEELDLYMHRHGMMPHVAIERAVAAGLAALNVADKAVGL